MKEIETKFAQQVEDSKIELEELLLERRRLNSRINKLNKMIKEPEELIKKKLLNLSDDYRKKLKTMMESCITLFISPENNDRFNLNQYKTIVKTFEKNNKELIDALDYRYGSTKVLLCMPNPLFGAKLHNDYGRWNLYTCPNKGYIEKGDFSFCTMKAPFVQKMYEYVGYESASMRIPIDNEQLIAFMIQSADNSIDEIFENIPRYEPKLKSIIYDYCFEKDLYLEHVAYSRFEVRDVNGNLYGLLE